MNKVVHISRIQINLFFVVDRSLMHLGNKLKIYLVTAFGDEKFNII